MRITFIIATLRLGGAERVASLLSNAFAEIGHDITIITRSKDSDFYSLDSSIKRVNLKPLRSSRTPIGGYFKNRTLIIQLRKSIKSSRPDLVLSFMNRTNIRVLMALKKRTFPVIVSEHNYPPENPLSVLWESLRKKWYPKADCLVSLSKGTDRYFDNIPASRRIVINNPVLFPEVMTMRKTDHNGRKRFISAGRLHPVKNYSFLIKCFSLIAEDLPEWDLIILGEGEERESLEALIEQKNLSGRVNLPGKVEDVWSYYASSDIFCLTSKTEGLGNVIIEAMGSGLPVISVDCPTGPGEIIRSDNEGILVGMNDLNVYSEAMKKLALCEETRFNLSNEGLRRAKDFDLESIIPQWETLFKKVIG